MPVSSSSAWGSISRVDRELLRGMAIVFSFAAIAAVVGAGKEVAIAWHYGVGATVDAYQLVFNLAQWPLAIFASVFITTLVPLAAQLRKVDPQELLLFQSSVTQAAFWFALPSALILFGVLHWLFQSSIVVQEAAIRLSLQTMTLPVSLAMGAGLIAVVACGWILAFNHHYNTLLQAIPALVVLLAIVIRGGGAETLAWATLLGFILYALFARLLAGRCGSQTFDPTPERLLARSGSWISRFRSAHWRALLVGMGTLVLGQVLISFVTLIDQFFAARMGVGALSTLGYANRIAALILSIVALAISRGMLPVLARINVEQPAKMRGIALRFGLAAAVLGTFLALVGAFAAELLVRVLFEHGQFTAKNTQAVSILVRYAMLQVPFYLVSMVMVSALLAQQRYSTVLRAAIINGLAKVVLASILVGKMGLPGLLLATAFVYLISAAYCGFRVGTYRSNSVESAQ